MDSRQALAPEAAVTLAERVQRIAESRAELGAAATALQADLGRRLDWRGWVKRHPLSASAVAVAAGWLLVSRFSASRRRSQGFIGLAASLLNSTAVSALLPLVVARLSAAYASWTEPSAERAEKG